MPQPQKKLTRKERLAKQRQMGIDPTTPRYLQKTDWEPEDLPLGFSRPEPLYPPEKMSWAEFQKMEKDAGLEVEDMLSKIDRLARKGLLNLDISSLPEPERSKAKELIKKVKKEFYKIHGKPYYSNTITAIIYISVLLGILLNIGGLMIGESSPDNSNNLKSKDPQKYVKILKKNKELRNLTGSLKQQAKTPAKTIDFLKKIVNLIEK